MGEEANTTISSPSTQKKNRIQIDLNASVKDTSTTFHHLSALPIVPEDSKPYTPVLYTFRVKTKGKTTKLKNAISKPPPFYLLLDHTLAVVWTLFGKNTDKKNLGIVQLQWALYFLQSIRNIEGVHPKDIQLCIDTIEDYLIAEYAEMSEESVIYGANKFNGPRGATDTEENAPFSVNYSQMIDKCPTPVAEESDLENFDKELMQELENIKKLVGIESVDLTKVASKEQVMDVLNDMKKEQIEKITNDVKMLYVVEDMMKNTDSPNFKGYTDEKQFESIFKKNK